MSFGRSTLRAFAFIAAASSLAIAQQFPACPVPGRAGPDLIVGEINSVQNYTAVGALEALSLGTTACNVGTQAVNWFASTVNHPVIGNNLYRYRLVGGAGRFEQIGQSWVKHAFLALSETLCCPTCNGDPMMERLGVGCSDPYSAAQNGTQSMLGPRYQVNAHTGAFLATPPRPSGGNNGRIQVDVADLEPTGAGSTTRYFGESVYVAPDDAAANNGDDNTAWRELTVSGSGTAWTFSMTGPTRREKTALDAWRTIDPAVVLRDLLVPEGTNAPFDGHARLVLASRVTSLGGDVWRYEYALENVNSDRAVQGFSVPIAAGVVITNVGFHDVDYLGGDGLAGTNQSGVDWASSASSGAIAWGCDRFTQNPNANALRWGTTYNFRFDASAPPAVGAITLTQFKLSNAVLVSGVDVPGAPSTAPGAVFCAADGQSPGATPCPCSNLGGAGRGCANSVSVNGALLGATGRTIDDTVVLHASSMPASVSSIFLKGSQSNGAGVAFGDGVRCVDGALLRLGTVQNAGGASSYPSGAQLSVSLRGQTPIGSGLVGWYQTYYRNSASAFCPPETFNVTNGYAITW